MAGWSLRPWDQMNQCQSGSYVHIRKNLVVPQCCPGCGPEIAHGLQPAVQIYVTRRCCMDHPVSRETIGQELCEGGWLANHHRRHEELAIFLWGDEEFEPEGCTLHSLGTSYPWDIAPLVGAYNVFQVPIGVKADLIVISNLTWLELEIDRIQGKSMEQEFCMTRLDWGLD